ncbi:MAG: hypothetical protein GXP51_08220, partial [Deltaproteobacteria bacterium]|nr:hypothetical protein [Deltaproteobacteria bacterium]
MKEPKGSDDHWSYTTLQRNTDLLDVSNGKAYAADAGIGSFPRPLPRLSQQGWLLNFPDFKERNISQAALLGNILNFTSFTPRQNPCADSGESWLYALDFRIGATGGPVLPGPLVKDRSAADDAVAGGQCSRKRKKIG